MIIKYPYFTDNELSRRGYNYFLELYPDAENYNCKQVIDLVELEGIAVDSDILQFAYILHDKDDSKPHYHLAIKFKNAKRIKDFLDHYGLWNYNPNNNDIIVGRSNKKISRWYACLNYLLHNTKDSLDKYQYSEDEVVSNIPNTINNLRVGKDFDDIFLEIVDYINDNEHKISYKIVIDYCKKQGKDYIKCFRDRTNNFIFCNLIKERNYML